MKALSIKQPHAHHIAIGRKTIEIRTWATDYRGPLLICSSQKTASMCDYPRGVTICIVDLIDVCTFEPHHAKRALTHYRLNYYAFMLRKPRIVRNISIIGQLGLYDPPAAILRILKRSR